MKGATPLARKIINEVDTLNSLFVEAAKMNLQVDAGLAENKLKDVKVAARFLKVDVYVHEKISPDQTPQFKVSYGETDSPD
jgi:hypothetical protein